MPLSPQSFHIEDGSTLFAEVREHPTFLVLEIIERAPDYSYTPTKRGYVDHSSTMYFSGKNQPLARLIAGAINDFRAAQAREEAAAAQAGEKVPAE